jgi:hypothetical protein
METPGVGQSRSRKHRLKPDPEISLDISQSLLVDKVFYYLNLETAK